MLTIRGAVLEDAERLLEIYRPYVEGTAISFEYETPTPEEFRERVRKTTERYPWLVAERDGRVEGYAYAGPFKSRAGYARSSEVSIYIDRASRGQGMGRILYEALERHLEKMGIRNLYACIACPREPDEYLTTDSPAFHAHMGFVRVGEFHRCAFKFGHWYNMIYMEKHIGEPG